MTHFWYMQDVKEGGSVENYTWGDSGCNDDGPVELFGFYYYVVLDYIQREKIHTLLSLLK